MAVNAGATVVATQDWHPESTPHFAKDGGIWPVHCVADTWGAELHPDLRLPDGAAIVRKGANGEDGYSGFTMRDPITGETIADGARGDPARRRHPTASWSSASRPTTASRRRRSTRRRLGFETAVLTDAVAAVDLEPGDGDRAIEAMATPASRCGGR